VKLLTIVYTLAIIVIGVLVSTDSAPFLLKMAHHVPGRDKTIHLLLMGGLAALVNGTLGGRRARRLPLATGTIVVLAVVTAEEFVQLAIPTRSFSWGDLACDWAGILILGEAAAVLARSRASGHDDGPDERNPDAACEALQGHRDRD
jgi:hypothetical protein